MAMLYNQRVFQADGCIQTFRRDLGTREPCLVAARHREKATGSIAETNFSMYCSSKQPPNMFFFSQTMTYYDIFISFSHSIWWFKKKPKTTFFPLKKLPLVAPEIHGWWSHRGPGLGELVRPQRLPPAEGRGGGTAKTKVGTSRAFWKTEKQRKLAWKKIVTWKWKLRNV